MKIRRSLLRDTIALETYSGESGIGPVYAAAVSVQCNVDATRKMVRDQAGDQVVSEATLYVHPADASGFTPESRVTIAGRASAVLGVTPRTFRGTDVLTEVSCS